MASLMDLAAAGKTVPIQGKDIPVVGVSARGVAALMTRFPEIAKVLSGIASDGEAVKKMAPEAIAAVIAAGTGYPGDEAAEKIASDLGIGDQLDLVDEILRQTFPKGVAPFVAKLQELGLLAQVEVPDQQAPSSPATPTS